MNYYSNKKKYEPRDVNENYRLISLTFILIVASVSVLYFFTRTTFLTAYYTGVNIVTAFSFYRDKERAIQSRWRYPERFLKVLGWIGGAIGGFLGMFFFRHKTSVREFYICYGFSGIVHLLFITYILTQ